MITKSAIQFDIRPCAGNTIFDLVRGRLINESRVEVNRGLPAEVEKAKEDIAHRVWQQCYAEIASELQKLQHEIARIETAHPGASQPAMDQCRRLQDMLTANW